LIIVIGRAAELSDEKILSYLCSFSKRADEAEIGAKIYPGEAQIKSYFKSYLKDFAGKEKEVF